MEITLKQHLANLGWDKQFLNSDSTWARITLAGHEPVFEPFKRWQRAFSSKRLSLYQVFPLGTRIKFSESIKDDSYYDGPFWFLWWIKIYCFFKGVDSKEVLSTPVFDGYVETNDCTSFSDFPWDKFLTVKWHGTFSFGYEEENGKILEISHIALTYVAQIQIFVGDIPGEYQPFLKPTDPKSQYERGKQLQFGIRG